MDPSSLTKTSFCGKQIDNVTSNETKDYILKDMKLKCNVEYNSRYAKIFNNQYSKNLNNPHVICLKSGGNPYLLFFTQINSINYAFLIDKKVKDGYDFPKIFLLHYRFDPSLFTGSLFETELVRDKNSNWFLLIADLYVFKSDKCVTKTIIDRMNIIHSMMDNEYTDDSFCNICPIQVKKYFDYKDYNQTIQEYIPSLNYSVRGIYFVPLKPSYSKILFLFPKDDMKQIKVDYNKKVNKNIHFKIVKTMKPDVYELYLKGSNNIIKNGIACIPDFKTSELMNDMFDTNLEEYFVECKMNEKFKKWQPIKESTFMSQSDEL